MAVTVFQYPPIMALRKKRRPAHQIPCELCEFACDCRGIGNRVATTYHASGLACGLWGSWRWPDSVRRSGRSTVCWATAGIAACLQQGEKLLSIDQGEQEEQRVRNAMSWKTHSTARYTLDYGGSDDPQTAHRTWRTLARRARDQLRGYLMETIYCERNW